MAELDATATTRHPDRHVSSHPPGATPSQVPPSPEDIEALEAKVAEAERALEEDTIPFSARRHIEELVLAARDLIRRARSQSR